MREEPSLIGKDLLRSITHSNPAASLYILQFLSAFLYPVCRTHQTVRLSRISLKLSRRARLAQRVRRPDHATAVPQTLRASGVPPATFLKLAKDRGKWRTRWQGSRTNSSPRCTTGTAITSLATQLDRAAELGRSFAR